MFEKDTRGGEALGKSGADIVSAHFIEHDSTIEADVAAESTDDSEQAGQGDVFEGL